MQARLKSLEKSKGVETVRAVLERQRDILRETFSEAKAQALFARFKQNGTWQCPDTHRLARDRVAR